ncbi:pyrokinin-1 receptor [Lasioglossum baleicum]|uniref:pyrokinin-1 receptor n=1 Tax=Lasioglossum baleicum TaxID=434251 RepID=UPI003FCC58B2
MISGGLNASGDLEGAIRSSVQYDPTREDLLIPGARFENHTSPIVEFLQQEDSSTRRDPLYIVLPITVIYAVIFFTGLIGNVSTCVVIARNKSMHTATNYYLFSLAVSDLLLLLSGLPQEMYYIWSRFPYVFGEAFCIIQGFAAETSANATVLTITAFTVERYVAICHPIISHTMSKLSRAVKFVIVIWVLALCLAVPQAIQFGIVYEYSNGSAILDTARCSVKSILIEHAFQISTMLFFVVPMTIITVLYILIGIQLRRSRRLTATVKRNHLSTGLTHCDSGRGKSAAQRNVIHMLVAVVVAFFICWAPFHAQRLLAVYAQSTNAEPEDALVIVYTILTYVSGIFYYLSTTVNPVLYNIMSNKFREAFKSMLSNHCGRKSVPRQPTYSSLSRYPRSIIRQTVDRQNSQSISVSEDNQKMTSIGWSTICTELNDLQPAKE